MSRAKSQGGQPTRGTPAFLPERGIELLSEQIRKASDLLSKRPINENHFNSWDNTTRSFVEKAFGDNHPNIIDFLDTHSSANYLWSPAEWEQHRAEALEAKIAAIEGYIEQLSAEAANQKTDTLTQGALSAKKSRKVFIVHGHDGELKEATARLVTNLGLEPIILHEQPNQGQTIIEKFDRHAQQVGFAIVLLSADDVGGPKDASPKFLGVDHTHRVGDPIMKASSSLQPRARQNVVFELGFFFGSLGRGRVCAVYEMGVGCHLICKGLSTSCTTREEAGSTLSRRRSKQPVTVSI
jgi:hypothetical protein